MNLVKKFDPLGNCELRFPVAIVDTFGILVDDPVFGVAVDLPCRIEEGGDLMNKELEKEKADYNKRRDLRQSDVCVCGHSLMVHIASCQVRRCWCSSFTKRR